MRLIGPSARCPELLSCSLRALLSGTAKSAAVLFLASIVTPHLRAQSPAAPPQDQSQPAAATTAATAVPVPQPEYGAPKKKPTEKQLRKAADLYVQGAKALQANDPRAAQKFFIQAAELDPENPSYAQAKELARQHVVTLLVQEAEKARIAGNDDVALAKLTEAHQMDPKNSVVTQHVEVLADNAVRTERNDSVDAQIATPVELAPAGGVHSFHLRATQSDLIRQVLNAYGISSTFDESVKSRYERFDIDDLDFAKAAETLKLVTGTFFVPLDPRRVIVAQDTKDNREKFQRQVMETVYLPGLGSTELTEMGNIIRNVFDAQQTTVQPQNGTLTIRAPEQTLHAVNATLSDMLDGKSQILLEIRMYSIDRTRARNIGVTLPSELTAFNLYTEAQKITSQNQAFIDQLISSGVVQPGDTLGIIGALIAAGLLKNSIINNTFATVGGGLTLTGLSANGATANLNFNSSDIRTLDQVQLRLADQEAGTIRSGTRYPIITSVYTNTTQQALNNIAGLNSPGLSTALQSLGLGNLANSSNSAATSIPQVQYEDLGLTLKATPHIQKSGEVTLAVDLKIESLGVESLNNIPVLDNRQFQGTITLHAGDSAMLVSNLNKQQSHAVIGVPGISELPGLQSTTDKSTQVDVATLFVSITPIVVRRQHLGTTSPMVMLPSH